MTSTDFTDSSRGWCKSENLDVKFILSFRDSCFLFSGGLHYGSKCKGLTIMEGKTKKLLHTKPVVDFVSITDTPWESGKNIILFVAFV